MQDMAVIREHDSLSVNSLGAATGMAVWRKSSYSYANGNCVEVAGINRAVQVRDSKNAGGQALSFTPAAWRIFVRDVKAGHFDM